MAFASTSHRYGDQVKNGDDSVLPGNRFLQLKALRPSQRAQAIKNKLISDPENRTDLTGAITVVGTCLDMCPEFERHEREFQKDVDEWEKIPGTNPKRIDHTRAVKKYRRSAAGNEDPLPSDLRPPYILKKTLDYLLEDLLPTHGLAATYAFIRDRTRAIRTDFVIQHIKGPSAIECFERIARFHILAVHAFCDGEGNMAEEKEEIRGFDYWLEVEQMMKTLQSLIQFYDDRLVTDPEPSNEAEFRAYYLLAHIRSNSILHRLHNLPQHIFLSPIMQSALEFRAYAQSLSVSTTGTHGGSTTPSIHKSRAKLLVTSPPLQNFFTRFFKRIEDPATSYLLACLLEYHFGGVRKGAIQALWKACSSRHRGVPISDVGKLLGLSALNEAYAHDDIQVEEVLKKFGIKVEFDNKTEEKLAILNKNSLFDHNAQIIQRHSSTLVEPKRKELSDVELVNGSFEKAQMTWASTMQATPVMPPAPSLMVAPPSVPLTPTPTSHVPYGSFSGLRQVLQTSSPGAFITPSTKLSLFKGNLISVSAFSRGDSVPVHAPSPVISPSRLVDSPKLQSIPAKIASTNALGEIEHERHIQIKEKRSNSLELEKKAHEEEILRKKELQRLKEERERERLEEEQRKRKQKEEEQRKLIEREYEEQLKQRRREQIRTADLFYISHIFNRWKHAVVREGELRTAFRKSILEMGAVTGSYDERTVIQSPRNREFEDVISWEDLLEFSVSESRLDDVKHRRSKGKKRMDDEMILMAIKEAETSRRKLWERGTFLQFVEQSQCRGDVWLCTSPQSTSTGEWLRVKFDVQAAVGETVVCIPQGNSQGPSLIVVDLTPGHDDSVIQQDILRLRHILSCLRSGRHYIPSVLFLQWTGCEVLSTSISAEVNSYLDQGIILSARLLAFMNGDLDNQFQHALNEIPFDTGSNLDMDTSLACVLEFSEAICCVSMMEETVLSKENIRKRNASDNRSPSGDLAKKRYKRDDTADHGYKHPAVELSIKQPDALTRLKTSISNAKQSLESLRAARAKT